MGLKSARQGFTRVQAGSLRKSKLAHTTGFGNNCGLHALAHVIKSNFEDLKPEILNELGACFREYYQINQQNPLQVQEALVNIQNPVHLEVVWGPVLRLMLQKQNPKIGNMEMIADDFLAQFARKFKIQVSVYDQQFQKSSLGRKKLSNSIATLKLLNQNGNHWMFEWHDDDQNALAEHNRFYKDAFPYNSGEHAEAVKAHIKQAFEAQEENKPLDLDQVLYEFENPSQSDDFFKKIKRIYQQARTRIRSLFPASQILTLLEGITEFVLGILEPFLEMLKAFGKQFSPTTSGSQALDNDVQQTSSDDTKDNTDQNSTLEALRKKIQDIQDKAANVEQDPNIGANRMPDIMQLFSSLVSPTSQVQEILQQKGLFYEQITQKLSEVQQMLQNVTKLSSGIK